MILELETEDAEKVERILSNAVIIKRDAKLARILRMIRKQIDEQAD